jgi:uncharacterized membrane protein YeaQ/YmgE (transglycosylase-associated protein family)
MGSILVIAAVIIGGLIILSLALGLVGSIVWWLVVGLIAGLLASAILQERRSITGNVTMGLLGAVLSWLVFDVILRVGWINDFFVFKIIFATLGAMLLIGANRLFNRNTTNPTIKY